MDMETSFINQMPMLLGLTTFTNMVWEVLLPLTDPLLHTNLARGYGGYGGYG